jgi:hypothetical protein
MLPPYELSSSMANNINGGQYLNMDDLSILVSVPYVEFLLYVDLFWCGTTNSIPPRVTQLNQSDSCL